MADWGDDFSYSDAGGGDYTSLPPAADNNYWLQQYVNPAPQIQPDYGNLYSQGGQQGQRGWGSLLSPQGLLGMGGGLAGLLGAISGGGMGQRQMPQMGTNQRAVGNQLMGGTSPLQGMQMSLLQALASGQGLPPGYQKLVEQAYQPAMGDLYSQATEQGRQRGFYDAPATSPAGGAILGPGLAALQGQMAQSKLGLMQSLPGLFNAPIDLQIQAFGAMPYGQQQSQRLGPQIGQAIGQGLQGMGQAMAPNPFQQIMQWAQQNQGPMFGGLGGQYYNE